jgi:aspartate kinase
MVVMKFGGSSVGDAERIANVCNIVKSRVKEKPVVVLSAVKGVTDKLIDTAKAASRGEEVSRELDELKEKHHSILKELELDENLVDAQLEQFFKVVDKVFMMRKAGVEIMDEVQSFGERMSVRIAAALMNKIGVKAQAFDAYDVGMVTTPDYGKAEPLPDTEEKIAKFFSKLTDVAFVTGFIGKDTAGNITTLGRGGSDYTAAIIAAALNVPCEIWTDVNGIMTSDPRVVKDARTIDEISFNEASELAYFGARVLHPKTIWPAIRKNIPVKVLNSFEPSHKGTTIVSKASKTKEVIKAIAFKKNITLMNVESTRMLLAHGFLARLFTVFEDYKKSVDMVATSEVSVSLTIDNERDLENIQEDLEGVAEVKIGKNRTIISAVGEGMHNSKGVLARVFSALRDIRIEMLSGGASEINLSFIVDNKDADKVVQILHKEFFG